MNESEEKFEAYTATRGLGGRRVIVPDVEELVDDLAGAILAAAAQRTAAAGAFHLALSGGKSPEVLFRRLMLDPRYRTLPWNRTHVWLVDDRCVPETDERSNSKMIKECIVDHVPMEPDQFHPMPVMEEEGDRRYEKELRQILDTPQVAGRLDFVVLGMGTDGHTASLFPHTPALEEKQRWVVFNDGQTVAEPRPRMTMTYPLINAARAIGILCAGEAKYPTLQHVSLAHDDVGRFPITGIEPIFDDATLTWYLDHPAALGPGAPVDD